MIHVDLPYDFGTFVKVKDKDGNVDCCGVVSAYTVVDDIWIVWVSEYKETFCRIFLPEDVEPMNEIEISELKKKYNEG